MDAREDACRRCVVTCSACITSFLLVEDEAGYRTIRRCRELCGECMDTCRQLLDLMEQQSRYVESYGLFCAAICRLCAQECGRQSLPQTRDCQKACEACATLLGWQPATPVQKPS